MSKKIPVAEVFGPTIQGEGVDQGQVARFIRLGGCDYSCHWCDTPHAVLPEEVKKLPRLTDAEILDLCVALPGPLGWVVLTGGNPCLHELGGVVQELQRLGHLVSVETQGTRWKDWVYRCDRVCVSPKPPSSGMSGDVHRNFLAMFEEERYRLSPRAFLKVVVFEEADYEWALATHQRYPGVPFYLSAGNDAGKTVGHPGREDDRLLYEVREDLLAQSRWLTEKVLEDDRWKGNVTVQSQQHVLLWGNERGR